MLRTVVRRVWQINPGSLAQMLLPNLRSIAGPDSTRGQFCQGFREVSMARELIDPLPTHAQKGCNLGSSNELGFHSVIVVLTYD